MLPNEREYSLPLVIPRVSIGMEECLLPLRLGSPLPYHPLSRHFSLIIFVKYDVELQLKSVFLRSKPMPHHDW